MSRNYAVHFGASGVHFFDRETGTNVLCDEVNLPPALWSRAPRQISIAVTNACDLRCEFCYAPKSKATLDPYLVFKWLLELDKHGCLGIGFGGGEPTLHPALPLLCEFATHNTSLAVTMTTHGHHFTKALATQLQGNLQFIRVSVDTVGTQYEMIRGRSFQHLQNKLKLIREVAPFGINCVINSTTIEGLDSLAEFAANEGASELLLLPQQGTYRSSAATESTVYQMRTWIQAYRGPVPLSISASSSGGLPVMEVHSTDHPLAAYAHIDAAGLVKCSSYDEFGIPIGQGSVIDALEVLVKINGQEKR